MTPVTAYAAMTLFGLYLIWRGYVWQARQDRNSNLTDRTEG